MADTGASALAGSAYSSWEGVVADSNVRIFTDGSCANPMCARFALGAAARAKAVQCSRCLSATYCCARCQKVASKEHRAVCRAAPPSGT